MITLPPLSTHVGFCIFCGGAGETDDHVVPMALGGQHVLRKSSCERCRDDLNREVDQPVLKGLLLPPRLHYGLNRSKKRAPPTHARVTVSGVLEGPIGPGIAMPPPRTELLPIVETTRALTMPVLPPPSILSGKQPSVDSAFLMAGIQTFNGADLLTTPNRPVLEIDDFVLMLRMLAKSAYALSFLVEPRPTYHQLILPFIRGEIGDAGWLGGIVAKSEPSFALPYQMKLWNYKTYLMGSIQIFTQQGMPFYDFVLGRLPGFAAYR